jgi:septal ring factor EnvC (AmiA/AmiB activator)
MNPWNLIPWSISIIALVITIVTFIINRKKDLKTEQKDESSQFEGIREGLIKANIKLDQVCAVTNETRTDIKALNKDIVELDKRMSVIERDVQTAFKRIDELRDTINKEV